VSYSEHRLIVARTARWGLVGALTPDTTDVWMVLHGYGHLAAMIAASTEWPAHATRAFVFPEALQRFYDADSASGRPHTEVPVGASWMTREARDDDIKDNNAYLSALAAEIRRLAPQASVTVLGFSQGAALGARWSETQVRAGTPPARLILWGGPLPPETDLGPESLLRAIPVTMVVGTRDRWISAERIAAERGRLDSAAFPHTFVQFEGGHRLDNATIARLAR
jgi:predicted esterase